MESAAKEIEWTKKLDTERERADGLTRELGAVRKELVDRTTAEASARVEKEELAAGLDKSETQWNKRFEAERERSKNLAQDAARAPATVAAELANKARTEIDLTTNITTGSATDRPTVRSPQGLSFFLNDAPLRVGRPLNSSGRRRLSAEGKKPR
jgi:hypothetical protein